MKKKLIVLYAILFSCLLWGNAYDEFIAISENEFAEIKKTNSQVYENIERNIKATRTTYDTYASLFETLDNQKDINFKKAGTIPEVVHLIWIGPRHFPKKSIRNIELWKEINPDFKIYFWTDRDNRKAIEGLDLDFVEFKNIHSFLESSDSSLVPLYYESSNYGEKSDLLRYMLLDKFGGIYADHDVTPLRNFKVLTNNFSFFCFAENIWPTANYAHDKKSNACIGACSQGRIISHTIELIKNNWSHHTELFNKLNHTTYDLNSSKLDSYLKTHLVVFRTFLPLSDAVIAKTPLEPSELILPPQFFSLRRIKDTKFSNYAFVNHAYLGEWQAGEPGSKERKIALPIKQSVKKYFFISSLVSFVLFALTIIVIRTLLRRGDSQ